MARLGSFLFTLLFAVAVLWPDMAPGYAHAARLQPTSLPTALRFRHLTANDGLPSNMVSTILQDRHGFMWFGTSEGLAQYDGYRVHVYRPEPDDPASNAGEVVTTMVEDAAGTLWVGTRDGGLSRLDPRTLTFSHYEIPSAQPDRPNSTGINALALDSAGALWAATNDGRLFRRDSAVDRLTLVELPPCGNPGKLKKIVTDPSGALWLLGSGIWRVDSVSGAATCQLGLTDSPTEFNDLLPDATNQLWLAASNGLYHFDPQNGQLNRMPLKLAASPGSPIPPDADVGPIISLHQDDNGWLWLGTVVNGLAIIDPQTEHVIAQYLHTYQI